MKANSIIKRELSLLLTVLILFSCWVFCAPTANVASAATGGNYTFKFVYYDSGNGANANSDCVCKFKYKTNNGYGTESSEITVINETKKISSGGESNGITKTYSCSGFITYVYCSGTTGNAAYPTFNMHVYAKKEGADDSTYKSVIDWTFWSKGNWGANNGSGSKSWNDFGNRPSASSIGFTGGATSISAPTNGSNTTSTYSASVYDQYGVVWYEDVDSYTYSSTCTGVTFNTSSHVATIAPTANSASTRSYTITAAKSGLTSATRTCTVSGWKYKVTFYDENGTTVLKATQEVTYGNSAAPPSNPTKASTAQYDYSFAGWTGDTYETLTSGKQTRTVKASYSSTEYNYTIQFTDANGNVMTSATQTKKYTEKITTPTGPSKTSANKVYTFAGWSTDGTSATAVSITSGTSTPQSLGLNGSSGSAARTVTYKPYYTEQTRTYSIPFKTADAVNNPNDDTKFSTYNKTTDYGSRPVPDSVTNIDTNLWKRTFTGEWESSVGGTKYTTANLPAITVSNPASDTYTVPTYTAQYTTTYYSYVINYKNGDNSNALTNTIHYNGTLTLPTAGTITKAADAQYTYTFVGWKEGTEATWSETATVAECVSISNSTKPSDIGLSKSSLTKTYAPYFLATKNKYTITFNWKDASYADQSQTLSNQVYGTTPTAPTIPLTITTNDKIYTFKGWNTNGGTVASVTGNAVYTAFYTDEFRPYNITFSWVNPADVSQNHTKVDSIRYGTTPTPPDLTNLDIAGYAEDEHVYTTPLGTYTFNAWKPTISSVTGATTYEADYSLVKTDYTLTFYDEDGETVLAAPTYNWDSGLSAPVSPTKAATAQYTYTFAGWKVDDTETVIQPSYFTGKTMEDLGGNHYYTATYSSTVNQYTITYKKSDGSDYKTVPNVPYGTVPADMTGDNAVPALIVKDPDATYHYTASWDNDINTAIEGNITFRIVDTPIAHEAYLGEATVTKEATCMETGLKEQTCSACNYVVKTVIPIAPNAHNWQRYENCDEEHISALDAFVPVVFECANGCGNYCAATYNNEESKYEPNESAMSTDPTDSQMTVNSEIIPTPTFNNYCIETFGDESYYYNQRLASLRVRQSEIDAPTQAMRFSGNLETYKFSEAAQGVNVYGCDPDRIFDGTNLMSLAEIRAKNEADKNAYPDNTVIDFGFVYTQARYIIKDGTTNVLDYDKMLLDHENSTDRIYRMSVVGNNKDNGPLRDNNNWQGFTDCAHSEVGAGQFTFNLVININQKNYQSVYCARTYVVYKYRGDIIVIYDKPSEDFESVMRYSHDSVYNQAEKNLAKQPPASIENYLNYKIIEITNPESSRYVEQKYPDYNMPYQVKEELSQS